METTKGVNVDTVPGRAEGIPTVLELEILYSKVVVYSTVQSPVYDAYSN